MTAAIRARLSRHTGVILILVLAGVLRLMYLWAYQDLPDWTMLTVDNNYHHHWAQSIAGGNVWGDTTYFRAPFYVYCLGTLYALFGSSLWVGRLFGLGVGLAAIIVTYMLGRRIFNQRVAVVAGVLHAVYPVMIYFESELLLEPLFTFLLELAVFRLIIWTDHTTRRQALIAGICIGLAAITRPTALVLVPVVLVWIWLNRERVARAGRQSAMILIGLAIPIAPVSVRNLAVAGDPVLIASQAGINLYIGNNEQADGVSAVLPEPMGHNWQLRQVSFEAERARGMSLRPGQVSTYWTGQALSWIAHNPGRAVSLYMKKLYRNFSNREISNNRDLNHIFGRIGLLRVNPLNFATVFALAIMGLAAGTGRDRRMRLWAILTLVYIIVGAFFFFNSRFRMPVLPCYFVLAAAALSAFPSLLRRRLQARLALTAVLVGSGAVSLIPLVPLPAGAATQTKTAAGLYYYSHGDFERALERHRQARQADSTFPEINLNIGVCHLRLGHLDSARYYFEREIQLHPRRSKAYANLASISLLEEEYGRAVEHVTKALERQPFGVVEHLILLRALCAQATVPDSICWRQALQSSHDTGDDIFLLNQAAALLTERGMRTEAARLLQRARVSQPPPIERDDEAFTHTFRNSPERIRRQRARTMHQLGYLSGLRASYGQSIEYSRQAIELDPDLADAYVNLISSYLSSGQVGRADSTLSEALRRFPDNPHLAALRTTIRP